MAAFAPSISVLLVCDYVAGQKGADGRTSASL